MPNVLESVTNVIRSMVDEAEKMYKSQKERLQEFMRAEGIRLPSLSEPKPQSDPNAVPHGAKYTDDETAAGLAASIASGVVACATAATESVRNDVMLIWLQFESELVTFGATFKTLMRKKGWLQTPPSYVPLGAPNQQ